MLINSRFTHQNLAFGQSVHNKEPSQDFTFALSFVQSANTDSNFSKTLSSDSAQVQNAMNIRENIGVLNKIQYAEQSPKLLGFPLDDEGYLTTTFNNAAGIPEDFKIHSETIQKMLDYPMVYNLSTSEDLVNYFQTTYTRLQEIMGEKLHTTTGFFSQEQLNSMPHAFVTRDGSFGGEIKKLYSQEDVANSIFEIRYGDGRRYYNDPKSYYGILQLEPKAQYIVPSEDDLRDSDWSSEKYLDENGNLSQGGLLAFAVREGSMVVNQKSDFYTQSYYDIEEGKMTMEEYIRQYAKGDFLPKDEQWGHQEHAKENIAMASWIQDLGFKEEDLSEIKNEDFQKLQQSFRDLLFVSWRIEEKNELSKIQNTTFDIDDFILELFSKEPSLDYKLVAVSDSLLEEIEQKRKLEYENYQSKEKTQESILKKVQNASAALAKVEQFLKSA